MALPTEVTFYAQLACDDAEDCPICYEPLKDPLTTSCKHSFCLICLRDWLETASTCPCCRKKLCLNAAPRHFTDNGLRNTLSATNLRLHYLMNLTTLSTPTLVQLQCVTRNLAASLTPRRVRPTRRLLDDLSFLFGRPSPEFPMHAPFTFLRPDAPDDEPVFLGLEQWVPASLACVRRELAARLAPPASIVPQEHQDPELEMYQLILSSASTPGSPVNSLVTVAAHLNRLVDVNTFTSAQLARTDTLSEQLRLAVESRDAGNTATLARELAGLLNIPLPQWATSLNDISLGNEPAFSVLNRWTCQLRMDLVKCKMRRAERSWKYLSISAADLDACTIAQLVKLDILIEAIPVAVASRNAAGLESIVREIHVVLGMRPYHNLSANIFRDEETFPELQQYALQLGTHVRHCLSSRATVPPSSRTGCVCS